MGDNKMTREEVYKLIDGERDYQDNVVDPDPKRRSLEEHSVGDYMIMLHHYLRQADSAWCWVAGTDDALNSIRKIAGICVKCMEQHGAPARWIEEKA
jgi:ABC-type iron transport system FetAB ATPase subunit